MLKTEIILIKQSQNRRVAPRQAPDSFVAPQKSKQKKAPDLLALRVPSTPGLQSALAKLGLRPEAFLA
jgi:hypothetical protein